jgi:hypothetical protein
MVERIAALLGLKMIYSGEFFFPPPLASPFSPSLLLVPFCLPSSLFLPSLLPFLLALVTAPPPSYLLPSSSLPPPSPSSPPFQFLQEYTNDQLKEFKNTFKKLRAEEKLVPEEISQKFEKLLWFVTERDPEFLADAFLALIKVALWTRAEEEREREEMEKEGKEKEEGGGGEGEGGEGGVEGGGGGEGQGNKRKREEEEEQTGTQNKKSKSKSEK